MTSMTAAQREAKRAEKHTEAFARFLAKSETKLVASLIPPSEQPEALQTLMRAAFDAGVSSGSGEVVGEMLEAVIGGMAKRGPSLDDPFR